VTVPPGAPNIATSCANHGSPRINRVAPSLRNPNVQDSERLHGKGCWHHPRVHRLSRDGPEGHCRYPKDRVPPRTNSKLRQKAGQLRGRRVFPRLRCPPPGSGQLRGHHVSPWFQLPPPDSGQLRGRHVSPQLRLLPPSSEQLRGCHVSPGLQHPPSSSGQLRSCHVSHGRALQATSN
jgi:hypothetical protein